MTKTEIAWVAGLFEGEGCIVHRHYPRRKRGGSTVRQLVLGMTDQDVVRRLHAITGIGRVYKKAPGKPHWKPQLSWVSCTYGESASLLKKLLPYFGRRRAAAARKFLADPAKPVGGQQKPNCKRGHPKTGDNLYVSPAGVRHCRKCTRRAQKRWAREHPNYSRDWYRKNKSKTTRRAS